VQRVSRRNGYLQIDMQFLADVYMRCAQCNGARYRDEILDVTYRGARNIADVLEMSGSPRRSPSSAVSRKCRPG